MSTARDPIIVALIQALAERYGRDVTPYGTSDDEAEGTGFRVRGIAAVFSVLRLADTPPGMCDVQIESDPPGAYLSNALLDVPSLLDLVEQFRWPPESWPPPT